MFNLIKYEFIKKYRMFFVVCITTILAGIGLSIKFQEAGLPIFLGILSVGLFILYSVDVVLMYSQDLNKKAGYMVFMTPNSGYSIIGSKVITALLEGFGMLVFFILVMTINGLVVYGPNELFEINFSGIDIPYNEIISYILIILSAALLFAIEFLLTIYSAITIRKSVLANVKLKGLISFGIFLLLNYITGKIHVIPYRILDYSMDKNMNYIPSASDLLEFLTPAMITSVMVCIILTGISGYLLEKKINL